MDVTLTVDVEGERCEQPFSHECCMSLCHSISQEYFAMYIYVKNISIAFILYNIHNLIFCKHYRPDLHVVIHCLTSVTLSYGVHCLQLIAGMHILAFEYCAQSSHTGCCLQIRQYRVRIKWADNISWTNCPGTLWFGNDMLHATGSLIRDTRM